MSPPRREVPRPAKRPYRVYRRPAFGRDDREITTRLVTLKPADGHEWDGMLLRPRFGDPAFRKMILAVVSFRRGGEGGEGGGEKGEGVKE